MNTNRITRIALTLVLIGTTSFLFAGTDGNEPSKPAATANEIGTQIQELLDDANVADGIEKVENVEVTFSLDGQGRIIILDVDGYNWDLNKGVKKELKNQIINVEQNLTEKIYRIPIRFEIER